MLILIFISYAFIASGISTNKVLLQYLPPTLFVGMRMLLAGLILLAFIYRSSDRMRWRYIKHDILLLTLIAGLTTFIPSVLKAYALKNMFSGKVALLGSLDPFITAFYAYLLWGELLSPVKIVGMLLGIAGVAITIFSTSPAEQALTAWFIFSWPELAALGASAISRYGWINAQMILKKDRYTPAELNSVCMIISGVLSLTAAYFVDTAADINLPSLGIFTALMLYTIFGGNIVGYVLYSTMLKQHNVTFMSLAGFSVPIFVAIFGYLFLGEPFTWNFVFAALFIFAGLLIFYRDELKKIARHSFS